MEKDALFEVRIAEVPARKVRFREVGLLRLAAGHPELLELQHSEIGVIDLAFVETDSLYMLGPGPIQANGLAARENRFHEP